MNNDIQTEFFKGPKYQLNEVEDFDVFGDDEEFLQLMQEESIWTAVIDTPQETLMHDKNGKYGQNETIAAAETMRKSLDKDLGNDLEKALPEDMPETSTLPDSSMMQKDLENGLEILNEDIAEDIPDISTLPDVPDFNMDELPIFSKEATNQVLDCKLVDENITSPLEGDVFHTVDMSLPSRQIDDFPRSLISLDVLGKSPSPFAAIEEERPALKVSLRQRNAIQLHPFTLEKAHYQKLIRRSKLKDTLMDDNLTQANDDIGDTEFALSNTQLVDVSTDVIQTSQYIPPNRKYYKSKQKTHRISAPSKSNRKKSKEQLTPLTLRIPSLEKYGLPKLVTPLETEKSKSTKIITFAEKKGSKKKRSTARKPMRFAETMSKDIFAFDTTDLPSSTITINDNKDPSTANNRRMTGTHSIWDLPLPNDEEDGYSFDYDIENDDNMDVEDTQLNFSNRLRNKKHFGIDSDDDSIIEEKPTPTKEELDALFTFPTEPTLSENPPPLKDFSDEEKIVPIVPDKLEYKGTKRQRMTLQSLLKNRKVLRGILPASFLKIYASQIEEEMKSKKQAKLAKPTASKPTSSSNTRVKEKGVAARSTQDIFAAFRESESEDDTDDSEEYDYVMRFDAQKSSNSRISTGSDTFRLPLTRSNSSCTLHTIPVKHSSQSSLTSSTNSKSRQREHNSDSPNQSVIRQDYTQPYPLEESIEDNRINPLHHRPISTNARQTTVSKSNKSGRRKTPKSSIAIGKPLEGHNLQYSFQIRDNATPQRRRKRPKRPKDDIYIHAPTFTWFNNDKSGQAPDNTARMFFRETHTTVRKAFDDIYVGTRQSARYANERWGTIQGHDHLNNEIMDHNNGQQHLFNEADSIHVIHSLQSIIKRIRHLYDHDLRRIRGLNDTVYMHHHLLQSLMSENPNLKSAYKHFQQEFEDLHLFDRHYSWKNINCDGKEIIDFLFSKATQDVYHFCTKCQEEGQGIADIPYHDQFYIFVSICLTQWIPCHLYEEQVQLLDLFLEHIRCLAGLVPRLIEEGIPSNIPWRPIIKLLLFILDWTCRLHHLGIHPMDWAVTDCTQYLMDVLVYIGHECIRSTVDCKEYVVEAWVCLIQIVSVSSKGCGYYFHEQIFVAQLIDSIKRKSKASSSYEYEKRKTTRLWAETLNYILDQYIMP